MGRQHGQGRDGHDSLANLLLEIALDTVIEYLTMDSGSLHHNTDKFFNHVLEALDERRRHEQQQNKNNGSQSVTQYVTLGFGSQQPSVKIKKYAWEDEIGQDEQADYPDKFRPYIASKYNFY